MFIKLSSYPVLLLLLVFNFLAAQTPTDSIKTERYTQNNKGKIFFFYGGNRGYYTNSDLRITTGEGYDFVLHDISAHDRPSENINNYFNPLTLTAPQTNYRIGYYFHNKYNISIGLDHMKYVMDTHQTVNISGNYPDQYNGIQYQGGVINNGKIDLSDQSFLTYENTDGVNYINLELSRVDDISKIFKIKNTDKLQVNIVNGFGFGFCVPRTQASLFSKQQYDEFYVSLTGLGVHLKTGVNLTFFKHFFIQAETKGGFIDFKNLRLSYNESDRASQRFLYLQNTFVVGTIWKLF